MSSNSPTNTSKPEVTIMRSKSNENLDFRGDKDKGENLGTNRDKDDRTRAYQEDKTSNNTQSTSPEVSKDSLTPRTAENTSTTANMAMELQPPESDWLNLENDALEFKSLLSTLSRPTARKRLAKFASALQSLGTKLRQHEHATRILEAEKQTHVEDVARSVLHIAGEKRKLSETGTDQKSVKKGRFNDKDNASSVSFTIDRLPCPTNQQNENTQKLSNGKKLGPPRITDTPTTPIIGLPITQTIPAPVIELPNPHLSSPFYTPDAPILKAKDKFVYHQDRNHEKRCPDYSRSNTCPRGNKCTLFHVFDPQLESSFPKSVKKLYSKDDIEAFYKEFRHSNITRKNFNEKIKPDQKNTPKYSASFICPLDNVVYYAQPFSSTKPLHSSESSGLGVIKSEQGVFWYHHSLKAREALALIVIEALQIRRIGLKYQSNAEKISLQRAMKQVHHGTKESTVNLPKKKTISQNPLILPQIHPWNWMEIDFESRCDQFHDPQGCRYGRSCQLAHVHYPQMLTNERFPDRGALPQAYLQNFNHILVDSFFQRNKKDKQFVKGDIICVNNAIDNHGEMWFTASWRCPLEGTIFYAAGGPSGKVNEQNMFLYPSIDDAKLAVSGVVLNSFLSRGMKGSWDIAGSV